MSARASTAGSERRNVPPETGISRLLMNILRFQVLHSQSSSARLSIRSQPFPPAARGITESETAQAPSLYLDYSACPSQVAKKQNTSHPFFRLPEQQQRRAFSYIYFLINVDECGARPAVTARFVLLFPPCVLAPADSSSICVKKTRREIPPNYPR